jgi:transposase
MRGHSSRQVELFSYVPLESRVPESHPLRPLRELVERVLERMSKDFDAIYSHTGRPSIPPEQLLKALLLQVLFTIRSESQLMEHIRYNLLYRWFVGLGPDDKIWDETVFCKNRERLLEAEISRLFFQEVLKEAETRNLLSNDHFTVDGTQIEAWAGQKSFRPIGLQAKVDSAVLDKDPGNPTVNFRGEKRTNQTHESTTDWQARLYKKSSGVGARLSYLGHVLMENRSGLAVDAELTTATGRAEREAALSMIERLPTRGGRRTLGADKNYDARSFIEGLREYDMSPHVAQQITRGSAIDERTTRHPGYDVSQRKRKRVEEIFGWLKTVGPIRKTHFRGEDRVGWMFVFAVAAYNLIRIRNLMGIG